MAKQRYFILSTALILLLLAATPALAKGNSGTIVSLTVSGGSQFGDTIRISSQVRADTTIQNSNLYYQVIAPDGSTVLATHSASPPKGMQSGDLFSNNWTTNNSGWPTQGSYSVNLCWSTGNAHNCGIASRTTNFYSVPTLGWGLSLVAVALIGFWLWSHRLEFAKAR